MKETIDLAGMTSIPNDFMRRWRGKSIAFINAEEINTIGDGFLWGCDNLESLDLAPLVNLTTIGGAFLAWCENLESLDLTPLANVTTVGHSFLGRCKSLESLDLAPLVNVTTVGSGFLWGCKSLKPENITWPETEFWDEQRRLHERNH